MGSARFDVTGIGNAIVDILAQTDEAFIERHGLVKGAMKLIDRDQADRLSGELTNALMASGGSAANTIAGTQALGARSAYVGKIADDHFGHAFRHDLAKAGIHFETVPLEGKAPTARCIVLVTPDAQRTLNTYLGACSELTPLDVDKEVISASRITYLEGYLWDRPHAKEAFLYAADIAHQAGQKVALSLSDAFCVDRHRREFRELVKDHVDILFANETEILSLHQCADFETAARETRGMCEVAALTRSEKGAVLLRGSETFLVPAERVERVVDTTG
ncbi:MAG TPA: adenosine kinase, partial [Polyangiaceae bacterium]|nr:adenosine kinase [Polyangiaceae bacterium]